MKSTSIPRGLIIVQNIVTKIFSMPHVIRGKE